MIFRESSMIVHLSPGATLVAISSLCSVIFFDDSFILLNTYEFFLSFSEFVLYLLMSMRKYTHIKRWDIFTNCEDIGG